MRWTFPRPAGTQDLSAFCLDFSTTIGRGVNGVLLEHVTYRYGKLLPMKRLSLVAIAVVLTGCGTTKSAVFQQPPKKLSDGYAMSALLALKAIEGDTYVPEKNSNLVSRFTQDKLDTADVAAVSPEERNITGSLNEVYKQRLLINQNEAALKEAGNDWLPRSPSLSKKQNDAIIAKLTKWGDDIKSRKNQLATCFTDFDSSLRARSVDAPASCR